MAKRYICDSANPIMKDWLDNVHKPASEALATKKAFLMKQAEAMSHEWTEHWNSLFAKLQDAGIIDRSKNVNDYNMSISEADGVEQFLIEKNSESSELPEFLMKLLGGKITQLTDPKK